MEFNGCTWWDWTCTCVDRASRLQVYPLPCGPAKMLTFVGAAVAELGSPGTAELGRGELLSDFSWLCFSPWCFWTVLWCCFAVYWVVSVDVPGLVEHVVDIISHFEDVSAIFSSLIASASFIFFSLTSTALSEYILKFWYFYVPYTACYRFLLYYYISHLSMNIFYLFQSVLESEYLSYLPISLQL